MATTSSDCPVLMLVVHLPSQMAETITAECEQQNMRWDELAQAALVTAWRLSQVNSMSLYEWVRREQHAMDYDNG